MGKDENVRAAQEALLARARANSKASLGKYVPGSEPTLDVTRWYQQVQVTQCPVECQAGQVQCQYVKQIASHTSFRA